MRGLVFPLALLLIAACGSSSKKSDAKSAGAATAPGDDSLLMAGYEIREKDGGAQVGTVYKRDHGHGRVLYWVNDSKGKRRGYVTTNNRAFAYEYAMGERSKKAYFIGADTITASARKVIGHSKPVLLKQIDLDTWVRQGTIHERDAGNPEVSEKDADGDE